MKVDFIGHGLQKTAEKTVGDYLCSSFKDKKYENFIGFSAFTSLSGLKVVLPYISKNKQRFQQLKFYLGIAEKGTTKEALKSLLDENLATYYYQANHNLMHQKIYYFFGEKYHRLLLGSANLTKSGLFGTNDSGNIEGSFKIDFTSTDYNGKKLTNQIFDYFSSIIDLTNEFVFPLTYDAIEQLFNKKLICLEGEFANFENLKNNKKTKKKKINLTFLGNQKTEEHKPYQYKVTQKYLDSWDAYFDEYKKFKKENKIVTIPSNHLNTSLYLWYRKQKIFYYNNEIPKRHYQLLVKEGFYFGDAHELFAARAWEDKYQDLIKYYNENGHSWVKRRKKKTDPLKSLTDWCGNQRTYFRQDKLDEYRVERLEELGFIWEPPSLGALPDDDAWFVRLLELQDYKKKNHGSCHPPQINTNKKLQSLGKWVNDQITIHNAGRKHKITGERMFLDPTRKALLEEIGLDFQHQLNKHKKSFEKQIKNFLIFKDKYPDLKPPKGEYKKERNWRSQMKRKFDKLPGWKQKLLKDENIF